MKHFMFLPMTTLLESLSVLVSLNVMTLFLLKYIMQNYLKDLINFCCQGIKHYWIKEILQRCVSTIHVIAVKKMENKYHREATTVYANSLLMSVRSTS